MASPANPMAGALTSQIIQSLANKGTQGPTGPMGAMGTNPGSATSGVSKELSELQGADPQAIMGLLNQMKKQIVELIPHTAFKIPRVTTHLSGILKGLEQAIKEAQQAMSTAGAIEATPIGLSAASANPAAAGGGQVPGRSGMPAGLGAY